MTAHCVWTYCSLGLQTASGPAVLACCVTWFPADLVMRYWVLLTGKQEALVCGVSRVSLKILVGSFIMH